VSQDAEPREPDEIEHWLIEVCQSLGLQITGGEEDLFTAGATSLTAIRLITKAEERYGEGALPPDDLYADGRVRQIAASIRRNGGRADAADQA
jgi:Phosphopantetheine attachment site